MLENLTSRVLSRIEKFSALKKVEKSNDENSVLVSSTMTRATELPLHIIPLQKPNEINYDTIISQIVGNTRKDKIKALILLEEDVQDDICVVRKENVATVLISTNLYGTPTGKNLISNVRDQIAAHHLTMKTSWCMPALVREIAQSSHLVTQGGDSEDARKQYDTEPNRLAFMEILRAALEVGASDVHIELKEDCGIVRFTIDTELWPWDNGRDGVVMKKVADALIGFAFYFSVDKGSNSAGTYSTSEPMNWTITETNFDNAHSIKLRMQTNPKLPEQGPDLIYRILPIGKSAKNLKLHDMGFSEDQRQEIHEGLLTSGGLFLIAGIPNSGKTTSIKAAIEEIPNRERKKIVIAEDPCEYVFDFASHATIQAGLNDADRPAKYAAMIAGWLRGNPHVFSTGEIRDNASAVAAITAAEVGAMVFATLHADSILGIFDRLTEKFIGLDLKSITSEGKFKTLVYQKLMPLLCVECRIPLSEMDLVTKTSMQAMGRKLSVDVSKVFYRQIGKTDCPCCNGRGVKGVTLVAEVYSPTLEFLNCMRNHDISGARKEWEKLSDGRLDSPFMAGKRVLHHGFYKMLNGALDPNSVRQLGRFESLLPSEHAVAREHNELKVGT